MSGVHQTDTDSHLVSVLGLRTHSKSPRVYQVLAPGILFVVEWGLQELSGLGQLSLSAQTDQDLAV